MAGGTRCVVIADVVVSLCARVAHGAAAVVAATVVTAATHGQLGAWEEGC